MDGWKNDKKIENRENFNLFQYICLMFKKNDVIIEVPLKLFIVYWWEIISKKKSILVCNALIQS
jgi:hypothetical protein